MRKKVSKLVELGKDTITAIATPPGRGGIGIIRVSGGDALAIGKTIAGTDLPDRQAIYTQFHNPQKELIDTGIAIYFAGPNSFTGEDVVELQGHGGPVIQDLLIQETILLGARQARAGEFSERAFLNDKIDLTQAEAIADLIQSSTAQAAKAAVRSLQGEFAKKVQDLLKQLIHLRMYVEAAIDFPEEEIDFLADKKVSDGVQQLLLNIEQTIQQASQGSLLRNGLRLVIAGKPNAGKSSLLNALAGHDAAIVTSIPGTTRDTVTQTIDLDGLPVHIIDTAGLRASEDVVEKMGVERARKAMREADVVLYLVDTTNANEVDQHELDESNGQSFVVYNKIDLLDKPIHTHDLQISATTGAGMPELKKHIKQLAGFDSQAETIFTARRRHLTALENAHEAVVKGLDQLQNNKAGELLADELLQAQNSLNQITGTFTSDDLLSEIFSGFCIGK